MVIVTWEPEFWTRISTEGAKVRSLYGSTKVLSYFGSIVLLYYFGSTTLYFVRKYFRTKVLSKYESTSGSTKVRGYFRTFEGTNVYTQGLQRLALQYCIFVRTEVLSYDTSGSLILSRTFESTMYVYFRIISGSIISYFRTSTIKLSTYSTTTRTTTSTCSCSNIKTT